MPIPLTTLDHRHPPPPRGQAPGQNFRGAAIIPLVALALLSGCEAAGWIAQGVTGGRKTLLVEAEYHGLDNQRIAVLVDADLDVLHEHPLAQLEVAEAVSQRLAAQVPGATVLDARQVARFQQDNIYWNTATYAQLAERLNVNRLVLIELADYRLHEPGNVNIWKGTIRAHIAVAETDSDSPNDRAYATMVTAAYPPERPLGAIHADQLTIRKGMLDLFAYHVVGKFHDHEERRDL